MSHRPGSTAEVAAPVGRSVGPLHLCPGNYPAELTVPHGELDGAICPAVNCPGRSGSGERRGMGRRGGAAVVGQLGRGGVRVIRARRLQPIVPRQNQPGECVASFCHRQKGQFWCTENRTERKSPRSVLLLHSGRDTFTCPGRRRFSVALQGDLAFPIRRNISPVRVLLAHDKGSARICSFFPMPPGAWQYVFFVVGGVRQEGIWGAPQMAVKFVRGHIYRESQTRKKQYRKFPCYVPHTHSQFRPSKERSSHNPRRVN